MDLSILSDFNPWWTNKKVPPSFLGRFKRPLFSQLEKYLPRRQILLVYGLRRVGKTTLFYQLIDQLLRNQAPPLHLLYFSFDERIEELEELIQVYQNQVLKKELDQLERVYFFFDEIQKLKNWQEKVKLLYDRYPNFKILLSGSVSVSLQKKAQESLAGRIFDFYLPPLSFTEFLTWKGIKVDRKHLLLYQKKLTLLFFDYLRKGGFPEITTEEDDEIIRNYIKNTVLERIIYRDLPLEFGLKDVELLRTLVEMVAREPGMIINFDRLSRDLGRSKVTIINYFEYLKYGLIIREVKNLRPGFLVASRKAKKAYPYNPAFCFAYRQDFYQKKVLERIAETVVASSLNAIYYFRNSFEVDFILKRGTKIIPLEVKYGQIETGSIDRFLEKFNQEKGIIISKDVAEERDRLKIIPIWQFLLSPEEYLGLSP